MFKNFSKDLNAVLITALSGGLIMTWLAPFVIKMLFTPPVSFGTNCEPAADWSMNKLIISQLCGVVLGTVLGIVGLAMYSRRKQAKSANHVQPIVPQAKQ